MASRLEGTLVEEIDDEPGRPARPTAGPAAITEEERRPFSISGAAP